LCETIYHAIQSNKEIPNCITSYLREIQISMEGVRAGFEIFQVSNNVEAQFLLLKAIALEIHKVSLLAKRARISPKVVQEHYNKLALVSVRNAICHIEQRIEGQAKAHRSKEKALGRETSKIANGLAKSNDGGKTWKVNATSVFNFKFNGNDGAFTTVGLLNSFLVCQSESGCLALDLSPENFEKMYSSLVVSIKEIRTASDC